MFLVDLVLDRQFDVQLTPAKRERKNEKKLAQWLPVTGPQNVLLNYRTYYYENIQIDLLVNHGLSYYNTENMRSTCMFRRLVGRRDRVHSVRDIPWDSRCTDAPIH